LKRPCKRTVSGSNPLTGFPVQKQALADLLSALEWRADADVTGSTVDEIAAARSEVARDMGW